MSWNRRSFLARGLAATGALAVARPVLAATPRTAPRLMDEAIAALARHGGKVRHRDVVGLVDFAIPSRAPRFHLVDLVGGNVETLLVAHGKGSDPDHSGWLQRFSNVPGSEASSNGAYLTGSEYVGKHGRSQRLVGLDPTNNLAEERAIVVHAADYVGEDVLRMQGKLGRSQGCFAVRQDDLSLVLARLGEGRLIYASK
ncbi:MAG TPA: murein L,D-transpeptidase catalytic domain family protein [Chakrabartia sp.]|jgi:hypothetical protein|nr:murein L,D-transpeptidase catalytic domain family protein [Chakrabartia sp.]